MQGLVSAPGRAAFATLRAGSVGAAAAEGRGRPLRAASASRCVLASSAGRRAKTVIAGSRYTGTPLTNSPVKTAVLGVAATLATSVGTAFSHADAGKDAAIRAAAISASGHHVGARCEPAWRPDIAPLRFDDASAAVAPTGRGGAGRGGALTKRSNHRVRISDMMAGHRTRATPLTEIAS